MFLPPSNKQVRLLHVADDWSYLLLWYDPTDRHKPAYLWNAIRSHLLFDVSMLKMDFVWQVSISNSFKFSQNDNFNILIVLETLRSPMKASPLVSGQPLDESRKRERAICITLGCCCVQFQEPRPQPRQYLKAQRRYCLKREHGPETGNGNKWSWTDEEMKTGSRQPAEEGNCVWSYFVPVPVRTKDIYIKHFVDIVHCTAALRVETLDI